jgi:hypothetical protein
MGHQGIVKTKSLLREKVWFPGIDKTVATLVQDCYECQMSYDTKQRTNEDVSTPKCRDV